MEHQELATYERAVDLAKAEIARLTTELGEAHAARTAAFNTTKAKLIKMRRYILQHDLQIGECVAWNDLKAQFNIGISTEQDDAWLAQWMQDTQAPEIERIAARARRFVGSLKRFGGED